MNDAIVCEEDEIACNFRDDDCDSRIDEGGVGCICDDEGCVPCAEGEACDSACVGALCEENQECKATTWSCTDGALTCGPAQLAADGTMCSIGECMEGECIPTIECPGEGEDCSSDCQISEIQCRTPGEPVCVPLRLASSATVCREARNDCDLEERCTGRSGACPMDRFASDGQTCDFGGGNMCMGGDCVPSSCVEPPGSSCGMTTSACSVRVWRCIGGVDQCVTEAAVAGTLCREAEGDCDIPERCDGSNFDCPTDRFFDSRIVCRPSTDPCDPAERCSGLNRMCPIDSISSDGSLCSVSTCNDRCFEGRCVACAGTCGGDGGVCGMDTDMCICF